MRGKVTDQDLTNYALNELPPNERLYVESMLGISEECRNDVYTMMDLGEMLKEGLELEEDPAFTLNDAQRNRVLDVPVWTWPGVFRRVAAVALLGAGITFGVTRPAFWNDGGTVDKLATAGQAMQSLVGEVQTKDLMKVAEEYVARMKAASTPADTTDFQFVAVLPAQCTPVPNVPAMPDIAEM